MKEHCPLGTTPRKSGMSSETWASILAKRECLNQHRVATKVLQKEILEGAWYAWRSVKSRPPAEDIRRHTSERQSRAKETDANIAFTSCMVELLNGVTVRHSRNDATRRHDNIIEEAVKAHECNNMTEVYRCFKSLKTRPAKALSMVRGLDGDNASTPVEAIGI